MKFDHTTVVPKNSDIRLTCHYENCDLPITDDDRVYFENAVKGVVYHEDCYKEMMNVNE